MPAKFTSRRADGYGHWPAGKRRNPDGGKWGKTRLALRRFLGSHWERGRVTATALAGELGVNPRTVNRWIAGEDRPDVATQDAIAVWISERREETKQNKGEAK